MAKRTSPPEHTQHSPGEGELGAASEHLKSGAKLAMAETGLDNEGPSLATAVAVGVGVAILEPELIPGVLIGAGAMLAPKLLPALSGALRPVVKGLVKTGYSAGLAVREMVAEAGEQVQDLVAEARAEHHPTNGRGTAARQSAGEHGSKSQHHSSRQ